MKIILKKAFYVIQWYSMSCHRFHIHTKKKKKKEKKVTGSACLDYQTPRTFHSLNDSVVTH